MIRLSILLLACALLAGCASNVRFIQTDETFETSSKPHNAPVVLRTGRIERPHRVVGVIEAELGKRSRRPELNELLMDKARDVGADGVMLVEYDVERQVYMQHHRTVVRRNPGHRTVVHHSRPRVATRKTATGIAVVFE